MRAQEHSWINFIIGAVHGIFRCKMESDVTKISPDPLEVVVSALASGAGAMLTHRLPDIIDPPTSPRHRNVGHGVLPIGFASVTAYRAAQSVQNPIARRFLEGAAIGPAGHLLADASTPAGVNLIARGF
ncbi:MAG: hypothetical protein IPK80_29100 [Nannocystis sp.]|jgi:hypothetical protein|nr:hypothetical protein [Nannocystis sp.]